MALLHALQEQRERLSAPLRVVYVDHRWHPDSANWGKWVQAVCEKYQIACQVISLEEDLEKKNREAIARQKRYQALAEQLPERGVLLTAHHQDDQAETVLLNLCRGSGLAGLCAMPGRKPFAGGEHWRPWLDLSRQEIQRYIRRQHLDFIDDPSNDDPRYRRNWIRRQVLPVFRERYPAIDRSLAQSAQWAGQSLALESLLLDRLLPETLSGELPLSCIADEPEMLQSALIRRWLIRLGLPTPPKMQLEEWLRQIRRGGVHAQCDYAGLSLIRYRQALYCYHSPVIAPPPEFARFTVWPGIGEMDCVLPEQWGQKEPLRWALYPPGGHFSSGKRGISQPLQEWFQCLGIAPFMRQRSPLLFAGERLLWVGGIGVSSECPELVIHWRKPPGSVRIAG